MKVLDFIKFISLFYHKPCWSRQGDYWDQDFDTNKNCDDEEEISRLAMLEPSQCKTFDTGNDEQRTFMKCKANLASILQEKCDCSKVDNPGELLYCNIKWRQS